MARIRTIKPEFFRHEGLFDAERKSGLPLRVAFAGLWTVADREGRFRWRPRQLKLDVLPFDDADFDQVLEALVAAGFVERYTVAGEDYGYIPSWHKHQVINNRESASVLPAPEDCHRTAVESRDGDATGTRGDATGTPLVHAQAEGEGDRERNTAAGAALVANARPMTAADRVWAVGPKVFGDSSRARGQVGRLLKTFDAGVLADVLADAMLNPPHGETMAWVTAACQDRQKRAAPPRAQPVDEHPDWLEGTGFANVFEAQNAGCGPGNRHRFRNGAKVSA